MVDEPEGPPPTDTHTAPPVPTKAPIRHFQRGVKPHTVRPGDTIPQTADGTVDLKLVASEGGYPIADLERRAKHRQALEAVHVRREKAHDLWLAAVPYRKIAAQLGVSEATVQKYVKQVNARLPIDSIEHKRRALWLRLERMTQAAWPSALGGDRFAIENVVRISDRQAKLYGLDAPLKIASTTPDGTAWAPLALALDRMSAEELLVLRKYQTLRVLPDAVTEGELVEQAGG